MSRSVKGVKEGQKGVTCTMGMCVWGTDAEGSARARMQAAAWGGGTVGGSKVLVAEAKGCARRLPSQMSSPRPGHVRSVNAVPSVDITCVCSPMWRGQRDACEQAAVTKLMRGASSARSHTHPCCGLASLDLDGGCAARGEVGA